MAAAPESYTSSLIEALRAGTPQSGVSSPSMQLLPNSPDTTSAPINFTMPSLSGNTMTSGNLMQVPQFAPLPTYVPPPPVQTYAMAPAEYDAYFWNSQVG